MMKITKKTRTLRTLIIVLIFLSTISTIISTMVGAEEVSATLQQESGHGQVGNIQVMSAPTVETFVFKTSNVSPLDVPLGAVVVNFNDSQNLTVIPPMAEGYGIAPTFTVEGNSLIVALVKKTGAFVEASPIDTGGKKVIAKAKFRTNSDNATIALGFLTGGWNDPDGVSNAHVFYNTGKGFENWKEIEISFVSSKSLVTPFLQVADNLSVSANLGGQAGVQITDWVIYTEGSMPAPAPTATPTPIVEPETTPTNTPTPTPTSTPVVVAGADYSLSGNTLIIYDARNKLMMPTAAGIPEILGDTVGWMQGNSLALTTVGSDWHIDLSQLNLQIGTNRFNVRVADNNWLFSSIFKTPNGVNPLWHKTSSGYGAGNTTMVIEKKADGSFHLVPAGTDVPTRG